MLMRWEVECGKNLYGQEALDSIRLNPELYRQLASRYILIGHSMGGVVAREYTQNIKDDDVTNKKGIYPYILTGDERNLSIRAFTDNQKIKAYERQQGVCPICKQHFELAQMEADHITPWCEDGPTIDTNCQMLCRDCNRRKSDK